MASREREANLKAQNAKLLEEQVRLDAQLQDVTFSMHQAQKTHQDRIAQVSKRAFADGHNSVVREVREQWSSPEFASELMYGEYT